MPVPVRTSAVRSCGEYGSAAETASVRPRVSSAASSWIVSSLMISNSRVPPGVITFTVSPSSLFRERAADRRRRRDQSLGRIGVFRHHELEHQLLAGALDDVQRRSEAGAIGRNAIDVDQRDLGHALLQHADPRFDQPLTLLRRVVLGVLAQVAQLARALDLPRQLDLQLAIERVDLVFELLDQPLFHRFRHGRVMVPQCYSSCVPAITSRQNPIVARFRAAARGESTDQLLLDGVHLVVEALGAGIRIREAAVMTREQDESDPR